MAYQVKAIICNSSGQVFETIPITIPAGVVVTSGNVNIINTPNVNIANTPNVVATSGNVNILNTPSVTVSNTPNVTTTGSGNMIAATITEVASGNTGVQGVAATPNLRLIGVSTWEPTGSAARVVLRHGTDAAAPAIVLTSLAANESNTYWFGGEGIGCPNGIYVDRISGYTHLSIWTKVVS